MSSNQFPFSSVFVGGVQLSGEILRCLMKIDTGLKAVFCPTREAASKNSDYLDLKPLSGQLPFHYYSDINEPSTVDAIASYHPDVVYILGTSQIIREELLSVPKNGILGGHIALLPNNKGCNPIIWAIANGLKKSGVTLIWLNNGVDAGDIAAQREFEIAPEETSTDIYSKVSRMYQTMMEEDLIPQFLKGHFPRIHQPQGTFNYWRRRKPADGCIDWRMSANRIHNLVRALNPPYPGADFDYKGESYRAFRTEVDAAEENRIPGEVLSIEGKDILIKAGEGAVWLREHELDPSLIKVGKFL
jgi:methionyl-tRNA formyltransferase